MNLDFLNSLDPDFVFKNKSYITLMGSIVYGANENSSDVDLYGFTIPPKEILFPYSNGFIYGYDFPKSFEQYQEVGLSDGISNASYDVSIYSIVKYARLLNDGNPNLLDSLFTDDSEVIFIDEVGKLFRDNREDLLHKKSIPKLIGYSISQVEKIKNKKSHQNQKRSESIIKYGYDTKYAYHSYRLLSEAEMILKERTIELKRYSDLYKQIRNGLWSFSDFEAKMKEKIKEINDLIPLSKIPEEPNFNLMREILLSSFEIAGVK